MKKEIKKILNIQYEALRKGEDWRGSERAVYMAGYIPSTRRGVLVALFETESYEYEGQWYDIYNRLYTLTKDERRVLVNAGIFDKGWADRCGGPLKMI